MRMAGRKYVRNKGQKVGNILASTKRLIEDEGYERVTIRDIAKESGVSVGLIYKYFPGGKPEIVREIGMRFVTELTAAGRPESVDFEDFSGFLKGFFTANLAYYRNNRRFLSALAIATITDQKIFEGFEDVGEEKLEALTGFFSSFRGVDFSGKGEPWLFIAKWSDVTKSIMLHHAIYPSPFKPGEDDEELVGLLVKISLMMWDYRPAGPVQAV
jgi:AcrR family transcriptional regulator